jgi:methionyl-tRNA formyltransferase
MKIVFAGSPKFAVPALSALVENGFDVVAVLTQPDKPMGRKKDLTPTPVKEYAREKGIPVYDFAKVREHVEEIRSIGADTMITCAYGQILTRDILNIFPLGVWNLHASLLPKFRGASPIQSAILAGESHTGITVMKTELALDSGDILLVKRCEIGNKNCGELSEELSRLAAEAAIDTVKCLENGDTQLLMQDEAKVTFCKKIQKSDAKLNFNLPAEELFNLIRAMNPEPVAFCSLNGQTLNILSATVCEAQGKAGEVIEANKKGFVVACGNGGLQVTEIIPAGGKKMRAGDFVNGRKIKAGDYLD